MSTTPITKSSACEPRDLYDDVMSDKAVTNISNWTEPGTDDDFNEEAYRRRLDQNADILHTKLMDALVFE